jgi:hypothetical protein
MSSHSILPAVLVIALLVVLLWFVFGTQRNVQRGNRLLHWLQTGLPVLGKRTTLRWLGSSAAELKLSEPHEPLRHAEVVVVLEPRDVSLLWGWARAHRRRDFLILRAELAHPPDFELEVADRTGWTGRDRIRRSDPKGWEPAWGQEDVSFRGTSNADARLLREFWEELGRASGGVWRLSIGQASPHVEAHVLPPDTNTVQADRLFTAFHQLCRRLVE